MEIKREYYLNKLIKRQNNGLIKNISFVLRLIQQMIFILLERVLLMLRKKKRSESRVIYGIYSLSNIW